MEERCLPINVGVRIRPEQENTKNTLKCVYKDGQPPVVIVADRRQGFAFDQIFSSDVNQYEVYKNMLKPMLVKVLAGYNCTILAYGQTGTGKTYTMGTDPQKLNRSEDEGLISRALDDFFIESANKSQIQISISFIEIYNEKVFDLLTPTKTPLMVKGFNVKDMTCVPIKNGEAQHWLQVGGKNRHVRQMTQNSSSSRSHAIFTVYYTRTDNRITSKLHLVDLAGSESAGRTGNIGTPLKEGTSINKGLLTMGRVFHALSHHVSVIPYRESMLTRILYDSLRMDNYISLLVCVSPSEYDIAETIHSLRFADKAKSLRSKPQLEGIVADFDRSNPGVLGIVEPLSTVRKRKRPQTLFTSTLCKRSAMSNTKGSKINHSIDSPSFTSTLDSLSISTSTVLDDISNTQQNAMNFSPIVRKVKEIVNYKINDSQVKDLITEIAEYTLNSTRSKRTAVNSSPGMRKQLIFDSPLSEKLNNESPKTTTKEDTFKMPMIPAIRRLKTTEPDKQSPIHKQNPRRSIRLSSRLSMTASATFMPTPAPRFSIKPKRVGELIELHLPANNNSPFKPTRRSVRLSRRLIEKSPEKNPQIIKPTPAFRVVQKRRNARTVKNILDTPENVKALSARQQHEIKVLRNLNMGTEKTLQVLATVGPKTAAQILTFRKLNGEFKTIQDLNKIPTWEGKKFDKFLLANQLIL